MKPVRFECVHRNWNPLPGFEHLTPPSETVFEMRCLDTNCTASAKTLQGAYDNLMKAKQSYEMYQALRALGYEDREIFDMDLQQRKDVLEKGK